LRHVTEIDNTCCTVPILQTYETVSGVTVPTNCSFPLSDCDCNINWILAMDWTQADFFRKQGSIPTFRKAIMDYNIDETWLLFAKTAKPVWTGFVGSLKIGRLDLIF
jgi:hypothetical protein